MNKIIALVLFFIINSYGVKFLNSVREYQVNPVKGYVPWRFTGAEMFVLLTLGCAMLAVAPYGLLLFRLLFWMIFVLIGILRNKSHLSLVAMLYGVYILWFIVGFSYTPVPLYGLRQLAKYCLPFLLVLFVPSVVVHRELFHKGIQLVYLSFAIWAGMHLISWCGLGILLIPISGLYWWQPAILDAYGVILSITTVIFWLTKDRRLLWVMVVCAIIPGVGYVVRTGFIVMLISAMIMALFHYKVLALPYIAAIAVIAVSLVLFVPGIRDKMFYKEYSSNELVEGGFSSLSFDEIDSNGRFAMWDMMLNRFYYPSPLTGSGPGSQQAYLYARHAEGFGAGIVHCDYVQMLCDTGLIGLVLYALTSIAFVASCFFLYNDKSLSCECRYSAFIAGTSLCGLLAAMMTDNVVNYTMTTLAFPYTFYGMALGFKKLDNNHP